MFDFSLSVANSSAQGHMVIFLSIQVLLAIRKPECATENVHKSTHTDRGSLQTQDYIHILSDLLLEDYDTGHFLNMGCSWNSGQQLEIPHGKLSYYYYLHFVRIKFITCSVIAWIIINLS